MRSKLDIVDKSIAVLSTIVSRSGRFSVQDCMETTGLSKRSAQRYMTNLERLGYVKGDDYSPRGYKATEKTKQIFTVKA